jgi:glycine cleavage system H protein
VKYTESHEWVRVDGDVATVGVSDHAQQELGEIVEVNSDVADSPEMVNNSPQEGGWLFKVKVKDASELDELMSEEAYLEMISD